MRLSSYIVQEPLKQEVRFRKAWDMRTIVSTEPYHTKITHTYLYSIWVLVSFPKLSCFKAAQICSTVVTLHAQTVRFCMDRSRCVAF